MTTREIDNIKVHHRRRRYTIKVQSKIDRALESFIRINCTEWHYKASEEEREEFNKQVHAIIDAAREGKGDPMIVEIVQKTDTGRAPFDNIRDTAQKHIEKLAKTLPVADWVKSVPGAGLPGLGIIVGEAGDLSLYAGPAKLWKRLGYAPFDGLAGSSWKREKWRPRALSKEEWIANPFSGERYALTHQCAVWLKNTQWIGAKKSDDGVGRHKAPSKHPTDPGYYGRMYAERRKRTDETHPEWTKQHRHMDGLRIMMKSYLKDLWVEWHRVAALEQAEAAE